ncbi:conserved hypothetical protein [Ixodes scapularis]|uniref:BTB domain-containing protein n=1 Tax=Ixodes scapularis TaxID=6945 RepID=B7QFB7_IXOSC|nr:conserved hypothetical protein [Ixodes scapularis]|eukprot:XP_002414231.1 conserved hypothetical protein [Ixodes scapularis]
MRLTPPNIPRASGEGGIMLRQASLTTVGGLKSSSDGATRVASSQLPDGEALSGGDGGSGLEAQHVQGNHLSEAFLAMNCMRLKGQLCDVQLTAGGQQLRAHRLVLAASSPYFHAMFNSDMCEKSKGEVVLHDISFMALQLLVEFAYTGEVVITEANVQGLLPAASLVQVGSVRDACCSFLLRQLHPSNCLGIRSFADTHACRDLLCKSHRYALHHFREVAHTDEFLMLPLSQVEDLISSDELNVSSEELVYEATVAWIKHDLSERQKYVGKEGRWRLLPSMHSRRNSCGVAILERSLYAVGGNDGSLCLNSAERFDLAANMWDHVSSMHSRRTTHEVVQADGFLYAVGGNDGSSSLNTVERYDPRHNKWMLVTAMMLRRSSVGAAVLDCPVLERSAQERSYSTSTASSEP